MATLLDLPAFDSPWEGARVSYGASGSHGCEADLHTPTRKHTRAPFSREAPATFSVKVPRVTVPSTHTSSLSLLFLRGERALRLSQGCPRLRLRAAIPSYMVHTTPAMAYPTSYVWGFQFLHIPANTCHHLLFDSSHPNGCGVTFPCGFVSQQPMGLAR